MNTGIARLKRPGNKGGETARAILELPDLVHVLKNMPGLFRMAKHHGGTGFHAQVVGGFHDLKPGTGHAFIGGHLKADIITENFRTASGYGIKTCLPEPGHHSCNVHA